MKKMALFCGLISLLQAVGTLYANDFQRRFGPDSAIYNQTLYFAHLEPKQRDRRPRRSFREQIRTRMHKDETRRIRMEK